MPAAAAASEKIVALGLREMGKLRLFEAAYPEAARFSRRWPTDEVPGIRRMFGARWRSQARAVCMGVAPSLAASSESVVDWSGVKPPRGKKGA